jgi:soluble lytic murein transglycosylase-like protein
MAAGLLLFGGGVVVTNNRWRLDPRGNKYDAAFTTAEHKHGLPAGLLRRMAYQESRFNPSAKSPVGALGLMQFMPATAAQFGINPLDPFASIEAAGKYMASLFRQTGSWTGALAAYNWGIGNVLKKGLGRAPNETVAYMSMAADVGVV